MIARTSLSQVSRIALAAALMGAGLAACGKTDETAPPPPAERATTTTTTTAAGEPTADEAKAFVAKAEAAIEAAQIYAQRASWVRNTHITDDTETLEAKAGGEDTELESRLAREAHRFDHVQVDDVTRRKLTILERNLVLPAADRPGAADELATISSRLSSTYAKGQFTYNGPTVQIEGEGAVHSGDVLRLDPQAEGILRMSRDPKALQAAWEGWHTITPSMRADYPKLVELANEGARSMGYSDAGVLWRSKYDMDPAAFAQLTDKLWSQVMPFYRNLHCYVRARLNEKYGDAVQPRTGPIRTDLLGNMWAQEWGNIYDIVAPKGMTASYELGAVLATHGYVTPQSPGVPPGTDALDRAVAAHDKLAHDTAVKLMRVGEGFYSSLGFDPLPDTFWDRTQFIRPRGREVNCHASAWDIDARNDLRIKMCISQNAKGLADDFFTVHHELGHNYYQRAYNNQDYIFRDGANDGFHEAIGDFAGLNAVTPTYLNQVKLLGTVPGPQEDIPLLLRRALDSVAFLPFGLLVDKWRWEVFAGQVKPEQYNDRWWALVKQYQGVVPPGARPGNVFDPGAKFHIADSTPYMRYFLARIYEFQFYRAACKIAGWTGPLNRCSVYGSKAVGEKFRAMLQLGSSKPWPEVLEVFTGQRDIDATAIADYFKTLDVWLTEQNKNESCGWQ